MSGPIWLTREFRKLLAMALLSAGGMALTVFAAFVVQLVAERSVNDPWPLAYALYGMLGLVGLVLISLGWVIGRTNMKGNVGAASIELSGGETELTADVHVQSKGTEA